MSQSFLEKLARRPVTDMATHLAAAREHVLRNWFTSALTAPLPEAFLVALLHALQQTEGIAASGVWWRTDEAGWSCLHGCGELEAETAREEFAALAQDVELGERPAHQFRTLLDMWRRSRAWHTEAIVDHFPCAVITLDLPGAQAVIAWWGWLCPAQEGPDFANWLQTTADEAARLWTGAQAQRAALGVSQTIQNAGELAVVRMNQSGRVLSWNAGAQKLFGWPAEAAVGLPCQFLRPADVFDLLHHVQQCAGQARSLMLERAARRWDGVPLHIRLQLLPVPAEPAPDVLLLISDHSGPAQLRAQADLCDHVLRAMQGAVGEEHLTRLLQQAASAGGWESVSAWNFAGSEWSRRCHSSASEDIVHTKTSESELALLRRAAAAQSPQWPQATLHLRELLGWSSGQDDCRQLVAVPVCEGDQAQQVLLFRSVTPVEYDTGRDALIQQFAKLWALAIQQVELRNALQETTGQLQQLRNMDAIGMLSGGIAHDFNNLLAIILGNCELLEWQLPEGESRAILAEAQGAAERAATLTRRLLGFSRKRVKAEETININQRVGSLQEVLGRLLGPAVRVHVDLQPTLALTVLDPVECEQVLLNLAVNARDAMPNGGDLTIQTRNVTLDLRAVANHPHVRPGEFVAVSVTDTGCGMDAETVRQLFQPFFTTKAPGHGTGLGLSVISRIVQEAHGLVSVHSQPGAGTTFTVCFPQARQLLATTVVKCPVARCRGGEETVLVVEDEPSLRSVTRGLLEARGYTVWEAEHGQAALDLLETAGTPDLLLTDVMMPGVDGLQLSERVRQDRPELPVLLMSGSIDESSTDGQPLLMKPFTSERLLTAVREVLDRAAGAGDESAPAATGSNR